MGLGIASEPGVCPNCAEPMMLTVELRALSEAELHEQLRQRRRELCTPVRSRTRRPATSKLAPEIVELRAARQARRHRHR